MRATVCLCDQPLCNGLFALANFTTSMNSRIFTNNNMLLTSDTANKLNSAAAGAGVHHSANSNSVMNKAGSSSSVISNQISVDPRNKENYMPLHDFNEQRIAAMLGQANQSQNAFFTKALILSTLLMLWIIAPNILLEIAQTLQIIAI